MRALRAVIGRMTDKLFDRFIVRQIDRVQSRALHPNMLLLAEAQREAADFIKANMAGALAITRREDALRISLSRAPSEGLVLEFGVGGGDSIRAIARLLAGSSRIVHGFDSFEGLPEDWAGRHEEKGHYSSNGVLPEVPRGVQLHKGLFAETLPDFLTHHSGQCAFVHVDCDLYSSAKTVLQALAPRIGPGTVILFDEYFNYPSWADHEHKAFGEFVAEHDLSFEYLLWGFQEVAVIIK